MGAVGRRLGGSVAVCGLSSCGRPRVAGPGVHRRRTSECPAGRPVSALVRAACDERRRVLGMIVRVLGSKPSRVRQQQFPTGRRTNIERRASRISHAHRTATVPSIIGRPRSGSRGGGRHLDFGEPADWLSRWTGRRVIVDPWPAVTGTLRAAAWSQRCRGCLRRPLWRMFPSPRALNAHGLKMSHRERIAPRGRGAGVRQLTDAVLERTVRRAIAPPARVVAGSWHGSTSFGRGRQTRPVEHPIPE